MQRQLSGAEAEAPAALEGLSEALTDAVITLQGFKHEPLPHVARQWKVAGIMCRQLTEAIDVFTRSARAEPGFGSEHKAS